MGYNITRNIRVIFTLIGDSTLLSTPYCSSTTVEVKSSTPLFIFIIFINKTNNHINVYI